MPGDTQRATLTLEDAEVLAHDAYPAGQHVLRVRAPGLAARTLPGMFAHLSCGDGIPMRRPLSIMRASPSGGWIEFLYRVVGTGTAALARRRVGEAISVLGPIGRPFTVGERCRRPLLIGGGVGIPPLVCLAEHLCGQAQEPLALMGSEVPFPFPSHPHPRPVPGLPPAASLAHGLLEAWGVPSRLASLQGYEGCYRGYVTDLARVWLEALPAEARAQVEVFACGPHPMLEATARLARDFGLPCQVSLEEHMACAVGGCAGCTVQVSTPKGPAMKRVCVDGPVFDAYAVFGA
jgi:dihydroorotate dehydrogenase electron transfer subunit